MQKLSKEALQKISTREVFSQCPFCGILCKTKSAYLSHLLKRHIHVEVGGYITLDLK